MRYIVIADSGSTKTDWVLLQDNKVVHHMNTQGLNPYYITQEDLIGVVQFEVYEHFKAHLKDDNIAEVHFYGAGCSVQQQIDFMQQALSLVLPAMEVFVYHDMLGAARALCQQEEGIACILGTGSNSCYYDGKKIITSRPAPGFILGDEGGGAYLGKQFIRDYVYGNFPDKLKEYAQKELSLNLPDIYDNVYKRQMPNRYLASFAVFIHQELSGEFSSYFYPLVEQAFQAFFDCHVLRYPRVQGMPINAIGSVAFSFSEILEKVAINNGCIVKKVIKTPMDGLIEFHSR
jgi:N-acetylglucosamine kinase-like BadF-type ATPase